MSSIRITNGFKRLSDARLATRTSQIIADLTENFPTIAGLANLTSAQAAFETALAAAISGGTADKAVKREKKQLLVDQHYLMIANVVAMCDGDRVMAVKSGYSQVRPRTPAPAVTPAQNQQAENGPNPGELAYRFDKVAGAKSYLPQCTPDPLTADSQWNIFGSTSRKHLFTGLETGKRYWIRVAAIGSNGQCVLSEPILSKIVQ